jgi:hypothetical protein
LQIRGGYGVVGEQVAPDLLPHHVRGFGAQYLSRPAQVALELPVPVSCCRVRPAGCPAGLPSALPVRLSPLVSASKPLGRRGIAGRASALASEEFALAGRVDEAGVVTVW